ncbi:uncharacterized protein LOC131931187 [Physella acuta]|uniref:uncharacterized protein LOC131931187 n=1 Tax=Physella acuta TaxID=109671 RepID=UPI0027DC7348|nr:uncharacterized protein LOC131931187 [Physella acuta]
MLTNQDPKWGPETKSNEIEPGIEYSGDPIQLVESSETHTLELRTQSNLGTKTSCSSCKVNIEVSFVQTEVNCQGREIPDVVLLGNCSQSHSLADFMTGIGLTLMATIENLDEYISREKKVKMNFKVSNNEDPNLFQLYTVNLSVFDNHPLYLCQVVNDPHITPFQKNYYDFMMRGIYLLYKRKSEMFEVYAKAVTCYEGNPNTCNKEVAIISEDDVVYFRKDIAVEVYSRDNRISSKIYRKGHESFMVLFPTGTSVIVETDFGDTLKVLIQKSHYDDDNTTGLCDVTEMEEKSSLWSKTGALFNFTGTSPQNAIECACLAHRAPVCNQGHLVYRCEEQYDDITKDLLKAAITTPFNWSKST